MAVVTPVLHRLVSYGLAERVSWGLYRKAV